VRRPLRFLAHKLDLDEKQVAEFARIINELKTERAQAEVDRRRTVTALADAVASDEYQEQHAAHAGSLRVQSAERLQQAIANALKQIHGVLNTEQRARFAYLVRSGTLSL
jgi:Spy/CpxP family protein refolding chaperone